VTPAISARELGVSLGGSRLLSACSFTVEPGQWLGVVGPNGAGKTTLLRCLTGAVAYQGSVALGGREVARLPARERARLVAAVPQHPVFPPAMSVSEYVLLGRTPHLSLFAFESAADRRIASAVLDQLELGHLARRPLTTLSGGERQRAVIARALAQEPSVLVLDEPTAALDLGHQHEVLSLVDDLRQACGLTVVSALHDLTLGAQYADRFLLLNEGRIVASGTPEAVLRPELLETCYSTPVAVIDHDGVMVVLPPRPRRSQPAAPTP
jgi:iron complex transport system ATP-binding protein